VVRQEKPKHEEMFIITFPHTNKQETSAMSHFYTRLGGAQWTGRLSEPV